ncbi:MAG TPA: STAS domain-containing protein [Terriglobales bacterium]|jgi:anti-sigma B factor antagonist
MNIQTMTQIKVAKYLDTREARNFASRIKSELAAEEPCVIVDLSEVEKIDAAALDLFLRCILRVAKQDGVVRLAGLSPQAATVLELTRMDRIFAMFPEGAEALPYYEAPSVDMPARELVQHHSAA